MKVKGSELKQFMDDGWPGDEWYWDHDVFEDEPDISASYDTYDIGPLYYQGNEALDETSIDLATLIRKWRKSRKYDLFMVEVPKERTEDLRSVILSMGGKVR